MHAYYELETEIPANHQLTLQLPDIIPIGHAKVAIIYEMSEPSQSEIKTWKQDLLSISQWDIFEKEVAISSFSVNEKPKSPKQQYFQVTEQDLIYV